MSQKLTGQSISRRELEKRARRKAILGAAKALFAEKGYDAATLDDIASRAGYAKGTIYLYFPSKEELFLNLMEEEVGRFVDIIKGVLEQPGQPPERIGTLVRQVLIHFEANKEFFRIFTPGRGGLTAKRHPELRKRILPRYKEALSLTSRLIKEGIDGGEIKEFDSLTLAHALSGLVNAMIGRWILEGGKGSLKKYSDTILSVFFDGVRKPKSRKRNYA